MASKVAKCFVPKCHNTKKNAPDKVFFYVRECLKENWCHQVNVPYDPKFQYYCCEDHLNLEEDLENYHYWKLMKGRPILKPTATLKLNSRGECKDPLELDSIKLEETDAEEPSELEKLLMGKDNVPSVPKRKCYSSLPMTPKTFCSVGVQCKKTTADKSTNYNIRKLKPSPSTETAPTCDNPSLSDSTPLLETTESLTEDNLQQRKFFINLISKSPRSYLGIPKQFRWLLKHISEQNRNKLPELTLIITLFKIKQNDSLLRISDEFQIPSSEISQMFVKGIECLANFFQNLIYLPSPGQIETQLPHIFKRRYPNVQCIIYCLEVEIETPSDPLRQAQTWSNDKYGNTLKYLIVCTPNGFVAFVSKGFGGCISDKDIVEKSNLIDILPFNAVILAKGGFERVETPLMSKGVNLVRLNHPGINSSTEPTKEQVAQAKAIGTIGIYIEKMMERLTQFRMLYPLSEINYKHIGYMDQVLIIACGLVNLQVRAIENT